jgi:hypothetical protein
VFGTECKQILVIIGRKWFHLVETGTRKRIEHNITQPRHSNLLEWALIILDNITVLHQLSVNKRQHKTGEIVI